MLLTSFKNELFGDENSDLMYNTLLKKYKEAKESYYNKNVSIMSDEEFDALEKALKAYCEFRKFPDPTTSIGVEPIVVDYIRKIPMTSLSNTYDVEELYKWVTKTQNKANTGVEFSITPKFDGVSLQIIKEGDKTLFVTRGDGIKGTNVSCRELEEITNYAVSKLSTLTKDFDMRGEVYITRSNFEALNKDLISKGEKPYASLRNAASGILMSKSERVKYLSFVVWDVKNIFTSTHDIFEYYYKGVDNEIYKLCYKISSPVIDTLSDIATHYEHIRNSLSFPIDGFVVMVNRNDIKEILIGKDIKYPLYATSFKLKEIPVKTKLKSIELELSRTGLLSPVGILDPISIDGVTVSRVTLHNFNYIKEKNIYLNDVVGVIRSGGVIPKIVETEKTNESVEILPPVICPSCSSKLLHNQNGTIACPNALCPDVLSQKLVYFYSKENTGVKGCGIEIAKVIVERLKGKYNNPMDLCTLSLFSKEWLREDDVKSFKNFANNINKLKLDDSELYRLLSGLGINGLGVKRCRELNSFLIKAFKLIKDNVDSDNSESPFIGKEEEYLKMLTELGVEDNLKNDYLDASIHVLTNYAKLLKNS